MRLKKGIYNALFSTDIDIAINIKVVTSLGFYYLGGIASNEYIKKEVINSYRKVNRFYL